MRRDKDTILCLLDPPVYGSPVYAEKLLCYEMFLVAVADYLCISPLPTHHSPKPSHITAADWIFESDPNALFSFEFVTGALGMESADARRVITRMAELAINYKPPRNARSGWYLRELFAAAAEGRAPRSGHKGEPLQPRPRLFKDGHRVN